MGTEFSKNLVSFKDCPHKCNDGYYIDPYKSGNKRVECSYCRDKRREVVSSNSVDKDLNETLKKVLLLPEVLTGTAFDADTVLPDYFIKTLASTSVVEVKKQMKSLIDDAIVGELPNHSIMFNFGKKAVEDNFIYPLMVRSYIAGRTVTPLMTIPYIAKLRNIHEQYSTDAELDVITFDDIIKRDLCVVMIDAGASYTGINVVKGLMQLRASNRKPTIIVTNSWGSQIQDMTSEEGYYAYNLATLYSVEYVKKAEYKTNNKAPVSPISMTSEAFNQMTGVR